MKKNELVNIARLYYEKKQTQQKIANQLGISRMAVSRALAKCEEEGIVEIKIHLQDSYLDLEQRIAEKYALKEVHIVPYDENEQTLYQMLGEKALEILENKLASDSKVGIGWGATLNALKNVAAAQNPRKIGSTFIPLLGGYGNADSEFHANQIASSLAKAFGGHSLQLHAPAIVSSKRLKEELLSDPAIQQVFSMYHKLDVLINSFGCLTSPKASFLSSGYFREEDIEEIRRSRIEYDIASAIYLDEFGEKRNLEVLDRTVGIQESNYLNTPERIALAGGLEKQKPTYYIARSGYSNILIIDEQIAEYLLKK